MNEKSMGVATLGGGCFWCLEAVFQRLEGVEEVVSGYSGGESTNPSYEEVCGGLSGHAEVCRVVYDTNTISFQNILEVFWKTHDPTTLNRQGNDVGPQYRSVIFYHDKEQKEIAEFLKEKYDEIALWPKPIVTEISPLTEFYPAETYHQNYYNQNATQPYCNFIIRPKLEKLNQEFGEKLK
ncbi:MAG: peptide-methionine (S)-S-oxide reductase MsrA [Spirochaetota bacterium]